MIRRDFIKQAAVASTVILFPRLTSGASLGSQSESKRITAVVFDERYSDCQIFARALAEQGAVAFPMAGEAARVWYTSLRSHLADHGGWVAGLTTDADCGISIACGRELNLRLAFEGRHDSRNSKILRHDFRSVSGLPPSALFQQDEQWANALAVYLAHSTESGQSLNKTDSDFATKVFSPRSENHPGYLTSWLLTPIG